MARVPEDGRSSLRGYARDLGLAFQIADDLLDVEGTAEVTGKAVGKDAAAGKGTFVSLMGVERAREQARMLVDQAKSHLSGFGTQADLLREIADFAINRSH
jgi:farnesyl diphosphate synthase